MRRSQSADGTYERVLEIRDKAVETHTIQASVAKAIEAGVPNMTVVAVNDAQKVLDVSECKKAAQDVGADLTIFLGWSAFIDSLAAWTAESAFIWVEAAISNIRIRLQNLGLSTATVKEWDNVTSKPAFTVRSADPNAEAQ